MRQWVKTEGWLLGKQRQLETVQRKLQLRIDEYLKSPLMCKGCNAILSYNDKIRGKKFCNHSCSAIFYNTERRKIKRLCMHCSEPIYVGRNKFCNHSCSAAYKSNRAVVDNVDKLIKGELTDSNRGAIRKALIHLGVEYKCACCNISEWNNKPLSLTLNHIDGNASNNTIENFQFLCPNCDSQTEFYKSKNKGRGRKSLGLIKQPIESIPSLSSTLA